MSFFVLSQIVMAQPCYAHPRRFNVGTTNIFSSFVEGCVPYLVSLGKKFQAYHPDSSFLFQAKTALRSRMFVAGIILSDVPLAMIHSICPHGNRIWLVHIHLHQVPFILCWPWMHVLNKKSLFFYISVSLLRWRNYILSSLLETFFCLMPIYVTDL